MGSLITVSDLQVQNGEPKVQDLVLAKALGFSNPHQIRPLIKRHLSALNAFGEVSPTWEKPGAKGGRPSRVFFLNEEQAIYITAKSDTPRAAEITVEMVRVFRDYLKGELKPVKVKAHRRKPPEHQRVQSPGWVPALPTDGRYLVVVRGNQVADVRQVPSESCVIDGGDATSLWTFLNEFVPAENLPVALEIVSQRCAGRLLRANAHRGGA